VKNLRPLTLEEMSSLPIHIEVSSLLPASAERVFSTLADPEPWPQWFSLIRKVNYLTPDRRVGTERDVTTRIGVLREHFIAWQPNRLSFFVRQSNAVGMAAFAEDYQLEAHGDYCRLTWHIYADLKPMFRPLACVVRTAGRFMFSEGLLSFSAWLNNHR
jgi:hypothetical protein